MDKNRLSNVCKRLRGEIDETACKATLLLNKLDENPELVSDIKIKFLIEEMDRHCNSLLNLNKKVDILEGAA